MIYAAFGGWQRTGKELAVVALLAVVAAGVVSDIAAFLGTEAGLALRSHGDGPRMARSHGVDSRMATAVALIMANGASGLGGGLVAQGQGFSDVNMGLGVVVAGVAAVLVGELVVRPARGRIIRPLMAAVVGAVVYRLVPAGGTAAHGPEARDPGRSRRRARPAASAPQLAGGTRP